MKSKLCFACYSSITCWTIILGIIGNVQCEGNDWFLNNIPELHVPGYEFCGPGTKIEQKLDIPGVNPLDEACKKHDIMYWIFKDLACRHEADMELKGAALDRYNSKNADQKEKTVAWFIMNTMKAKLKLGIKKK